MISGSQEEVVRPIAELYGFDDFLAARLVVGSNGQLTGKIISPVFDKEAAIKQLVAKHGLTYQDSYGIGDTGKDAAMLKMVENPIVFNPTSGLLKTAKLSGWPVVIERKDVVYQLMPKDEAYQLQGADYEL
jgi:phosphoserine phosphatase